MTIAAVLPVRDAGHLLAACVDAVLGQTRPPDEVLIAVAPSRDRTREVAVALAGGRVRVVDNPAGDRASGINAAIAVSRASLIAMVDAQATLESDYLEQAEAILQDPGVAVVGGPMRPTGTTPIGRAMAAALRSPFGVGDSQFHFQGVARDAESVYLGVYRRSAFELVGRYNTALLRTEDDDLNARIRAAGLRIRLDPKLRSTYRCRDSLGAICTQYFGYGYWKVALATIRAGALRPRHLVPASFVVVGAVAVLAAVAGAWQPLAAMFGAWVAAAIVAAVLAPAQSPVDRLLFPAVAMTMHLAYGIGTVAAIPSLPRLRRSATEGARVAEGTAP